MAVRILILESKREVAQDLQERLSKLGYEVIGISTSGKETVQSVKELTPDVIIMNVRLQKGTDGIKTGELVRSRHDTPIIYMTEFGGQTIIRQTKATKPLGYIFIPFSDRQIYTTLETALLRHQYEKEIQEGRGWLAGILNSIADGVIAVNNEGQIRYINPVAQRLTGRTQNEAVGSPIDNVLILMDEKTHQRIVFSADPDPSNKVLHIPVFEALLLSHNNESTVVEVNVTRIANHGSSADGMVLAFRDIRKQRETMREIQRQAERAHMLVNAAEQLNTNLEFDTVLSTICQLANQAVKAWVTGLYLLDRKKGIYQNVSTVRELDQPATYQKSPIHIPMDLINSLLSTKNQVAILDRSQANKIAPYLESFSKETIQSIVVAGIFYKREFMGLLVSIFLRDPVPLQHADLELLKGLADHAAVSITNAKLLRQVLLGRESQRKLAKGIVQAQEEERRHIARELHDHLGQILTGLQFMLENAKNEEGNAQKALMEEIQDTVKDTIQQIKEMSLNLRPSMLDDMGLLPTLQWHLDRFKTQTGISVNFQSDKFQERFPPDTEIAAYRIVQEALTNVARHARVKEVFVGLVANNETLWIEILDQGVGFDLSTDVSSLTSGLRWMRERASTVGGYLVL